MLLQIQMPKFLRISVTIAGILFSVVAIFLLTDAAFLSSKVFTRLTYIRGVQPIGWFPFFTHKTNDGKIYMVRREIDALLAQETNLEF